MLELLTAVRRGPLSCATWNAAITRMAYKASASRVPIRGPSGKVHSCIHVCLLALTHSFPFAPAFGESLFYLCATNLLTKQGTPRFSADLGGSSVECWEAFASQHAEEPNRLWFVVLAPPPGVNTPADGKQPVGCHEGGLGRWVP